MTNPNPNPITPTPTPTPNAHPNPNQAFYREGVDDETWKPLLASQARPVYKEVEDALVWR